MQPGRLNQRAEVLSLGADLVSQSHGSRWVGIRSKAAADVPAANGLRTGAMVEVRARAGAELTVGRYLRLGSRLLHITSVRDPLGNKAELRISADELIGQPAQYLPADGYPAGCRVFLQHEAPVIDRMGQVIDYKTRAELALIEVGRAQPGDVLQVAGVGYQVVDYDDRSDDGIVRGVWLERVP